VNNKILALEKIKSKEKFSSEEWENRGLNPSENSLCIKLENSFNDLLTNLISANNTKKSDTEIENIFEHYFKEIKSDELDTEEREFVVDYFAEIAKILNITSINEELNFWTYGIEAYDYEEAEKKASEKILAEERKRHEILSIECPKCKTQLETFILERDNDIPSFEFDIIKCVKCSELNILDKGCGIKRYRFLNYELIEELAKEQYDLPKALQRLKELQNLE
jgi:phage FluMu protein Com